MKGNEESVESVADLFSLLSNPRHKVIFLLLLRLEGMVPSKELARELGVTTRTVKSDIKHMRVVVESFGIQILSKSSRGYRLAFKDHGQSRQIKEYFQIYQPNTVNTEQKLREQYILRRLLSTGQSVKTEQLQRELFLNESNSLHRELAEIKTFLHQYQLKLVTKPYYGLEIQGELFYRVSCTIRMYRYFYKNSSADLGVAEFNRLFVCDEHEKGSLRNILHKTLAGSDVVFSDIYAERLLMHLIFFRNVLEHNHTFVIDFPKLCFDYRITREYAMIEELMQKVRSLHAGFDFGEDILEYLALAAIMSTDLYRFRDCSEENYGGLIKVAEELRNHILTELSAYFGVNLFDDYTCFKDLLKIMIPISLKQTLKLSDDVDLGFHNLEVMNHKPVLNHAITFLCKGFAEKYGYHFSRREQYLLFTTVLGLFNRITLSHHKLKLALIAIDGRLSTQQLKFNLQHYFNEFIEKIETKMLYELDSMDAPDYDYYLCMEYGRHMNIEYAPIYYASEDLSEEEYVASLNNIFFNSYRYQELLPAICYTRISERFRFEPFEIEVLSNSAYDEIIIGHNFDIRLFLNFNSDKEQFHIYYFADAEAVTLYGEKYFIVVDTVIQDNSQKLKMIMNVFDQIFDNPALLRIQCEKESAMYHAFFTMVGCREI